MRVFQGSDETFDELEPSEVVPRPIGNLLDEFAAEGQILGRRFGCPGARLRFEARAIASPTTDNRLKDEEEAIRAGVEDVLFGGDLCLVEWPDRAPDIFPEDTVHVSLEVLDRHRYSRPEIEVEQIPSRISGAELRRSSAKNAAMRARPPTRSAHVNPELQP